MFKFKPKKVRKLREKHKLTVYSFGKRIGVKTNFVVNGYENGSITPSVPTLEKMCAEFGVEPNYFFT